MWSIFTEILAVMLCTNEEKLCSTKSTKVWRPITPSAALIQKMSVLHDADLAKLCTTPSYTKQSIYFPAQNFYCPEKMPKVVKIALCTYLC